MIVDYKSLMQSITNAALNIPGVLGVSYTPFGAETNNAKFPMIIILPESLYRNPASLVNLVNIKILYLDTYSTPDQILDIHNNAIIALTNLNNAFDFGLNQLTLRPIVDIKTSHKTSGYEMNMHINYIDDIGECSNTTTNQSNCS